MIGSQLLSGPAPKRPTTRKMLEVIRHLGAVQIDSIHVVARSHHIVLWSRLGNHPQSWLNDLLANHRAIFEYWTHAAAYSPIELYPCFRRAMLSGEKGGGARAARWKAENTDVIKQVIEYINEYGAVCTRSFDAPEGVERAAPWAWHGNKPTNRALDILWSDGTLMVDRRESFTRYYDLTESILPEWSDSEIPTVETERATLTEHTINALGVTTARWLPDYFRMNGWRQRSGGQSIAEEMLDYLVETGAALPATIDGIDEPAYVSAAAIDKRFKPGRTTLLSPFDSLVWDRLRTQQLWDFDLKLEAYTPKDQRQYGYFSLPILHRDRLVGRLDPKVDRKTGTLHIRTLHLEDDFQKEADDRFFNELAGCLLDFAAFNHADSIQIDPAVPQTTASKLNSAIRNSG